MLFIKIGAHNLEAALNESTKTLIILGGKIHYEHLNLRNNQVELLVSFGWWEPKLFRNYIRNKLEVNTPGVAQVKICKAKKALI